MDRGPHLHPRVPSTRPDGTGDAISHGLDMGRIGARATDALELGFDLDERIDNVGVEMRPATGHDRGDRLLVRPGGLVRPAAGQRVIDIDHRHDPAGGRIASPRSPAG